MAFVESTRGGNDFFLEEYSSGFRVSRADYKMKPLFIEEVMEAVKDFLSERGRPIPEKENLLVSGDGYYTLSLKDRQIMPGEKTDNRPLRRSF